MSNWEAASSVLNRVPEAVGVPRAEEAGQGEEEHGRASVVR